jgi:hypothetical protein
MMTKKLLRPLSERVREARALLDFGGQSIPSQGGKAKAAKVAERHASIRAHHAQLLASGKSGTFATKKTATEFKLSASQVRKIVAAPGVKSIAKP